MALTLKKFAMKEMESITMPEDPLKQLPLTTRTSMYECRRAKEEKNEIKEKKTDIKQNLARNSASTNDVRKVPAKPHTPVGPSTPTTSSSTPSPSGGGMEIKKEKEKDEDAHKPTPPSTRKKR